MIIFSASLIFILGAIIGSFLNVVILRLPQSQKLTGRSHCPYCGHILSWWELFPLFGYIFLGRRCASCHKKISPRYFIIEALTACLFALSFFLIQPSAPGGWFMLLRVVLAVCFFVVIFVIDLEHYLILDSVILTGLLGFTALNVAADIFYRTFWSWHGFTLNGLAAAAAASLVFFAIWFFSRGRWMGFGDVKLAALLGVILLYPQIWVGLMLAVFAGGIVSVFLLAFAGKNLKTQLPFATFLTVGALAALLFGPQLLNWYLSLI